MKEIQLAQGMVAIVDDEDYGEISKFKWRISGAGYVATTTKNEQFERVEEYIHRKIIGLKAFDGKFIDHINGDKLDNRRCNLRICTISENQHNKKINKNNTSGYKGVTWNKRDKKWYAQIWIESKKIHLGLFTTPEAAHAAYQDASLKYHGDFANFGDGCVIGENNDE